MSGELLLKFNSKGVKRKIVSTEQWGRNVRKQKRQSGLGYTPTLGKDVPPKGNPGRNGVAGQNEDMVRDYKRKTDRQSWSYESMNNAVDAVISGQFGYKKSSQQFNVPQSTLERYVKKRKKTLTIKLINQQENFKKYLVMSRNKS
ncbi:hypothetical protein J6590_031566 [Homalodisca vitripennis]|nr:hypothetical protein J6590_031566 [Homalodisca vitripennis]